MPNRTEAVVKVGTGRGFVIEAAGYPLRRRYVITAAHCLPRMPPRHAAAHAIERTFRRLLGPIGNRRRMVWAECIFVDPVADIAALAEPDANELPKESEAYQELTEADAVIPFPLGALTFTEEQRHSSGSGPFGGVFLGPPRASARGQMLSLDLRWVSCEVKSGGRSVSVTGGAPIESGMSGSPILGPDGAAIAVVSTSDQEGKGRAQPAVDGHVARLVAQVVAEGGCSPTAHRLLLRVIIGAYRTRGRRACPADKQAAPATCLS